LESDARPASKHGQICPIQDEAGWHWAIGATERHSLNVLVREKSALHRIVSRIIADVGRQLIGDVPCEGLLVPRPDPSQGKGKRLPNLWVIVIEGYRQLVSGYVGSTKGMPSPSDSAVFLLSV
jgi:hypothetical protein